MEKKRRRSLLTILGSVNGKPEAFPTVRRQSRKITIAIYRINVLLFITCRMLRIQPEILFLSGRINKCSSIIGSANVGLPNSVCQAERRLVRELLLTSGTICSHSNSCKAPDWNFESEAKS